MQVRKITKVIKLIPRYVQNFVLELQKAFIRIWKHVYIFFSQVVMCASVIHAHKNSFVNVVERFTMLVKKREKKKRINEIKHI